MNPTTHIWGARTSALPIETRQRRESRSGGPARGSPLRLRRAFAETSPADRRRRQGSDPERREAGPDAAVVHERRQPERDDEAAQRDRRLADAEREPALPGGNHAITARPLADWTLAPASPATRAERRAARSRARPRRAARAPHSDEADEEHEPLADPVGREPPRDQADERADERARDEEARLREREVVAVTQRRRHHRDAEPDRRVRRLRERARREDGPAVAVDYSPNGFVGRVPV